MYAGLLIRVWHSLAVRRKPTVRTSVKPGLAQTAVFKLNIFNPNKSWSTSIVSFMLGVAAKAAAASVYKDERFSDY